MWRPKEGWNNPYNIIVGYIPTVSDIQGTRNLMHNAYESGADAMYIALIKKLAGMSIPAQVGFISTHKKEIMKD